MLDRSYIGFALEPRHVLVEEGQLRFFAKATGETNPVYFDREAARADGHPAIPAPPTFAFTLNSLALPRTNWGEKVGLRTETALHGEQAFEYFKPIYAGDRITLSGRIADIYERKGGALEFVVVETDATNQAGELCVRMRQVGVSQNDRAPS